MSEKEESAVKKCPKCGGEMVRGQVATYMGRFGLKKPGDWVGDSIIPFYCKNCGYIELYKWMEELAPPVKLCPSCENMIPAAAEYCPYCGAKQKEKKE